MIMWYLMFMHYLMFRCSVYDDPLKIIRIPMFAISFTVVCLFVCLFLFFLFVCCLFGFVC